MFRFLYIYRKAVLFVNLFNMLTPWNKWKVVWRKKPLTPREVRTLRNILVNLWNQKELALFSLAIDSMLRSSDLLNLTVNDITNSYGEILKEINLKQIKTKEWHKIRLSNQTIVILAEYISAYNKFDDDYLFTSRNNPNKPIDWRYYRGLVKKWVKLVGLNPDNYSTHSLRRTRVSYIFKKTNNIEVARQLLGQKSVNSTTSYLDIEKDDAWNVADWFEI